ncbi:MAG: ferredoxin-type protein NapF [Aeromonas sp.]
MSDPMLPSRRQLLRAKVRAADLRAEPLALPWAKPWAEFTAGCTRCGACQAACPEAIITPGDGGFPVVDFSRGACTFCGQCAAICPEGLFLPRSAAPWALRAAIGTSCLARQQVYCQRCQDSCAAGAIRFTPRLRQVPSPEVETHACTGCGACVQDCPVNAITMQIPVTAVEA